MDFKKDDVAVIKKGVMGEGTELVVLGDPVFKDQWWVPVAVPNEEDPTFFKAIHLELKNKRNYFVIKKHYKGGSDRYILSTSLSEEDLYLPDIGERLTAYDGDGYCSEWTIEASLLTNVNPDLLNEKVLSIAGDSVFRVRD